jgi:hypothetical protein
VSRFVNGNMQKIIDHLFRATEAAWRCCSLCALLHQELQHHAMVIGQVTPVTYRSFQLH